MSKLSARNADFRVQNYHDECMHKPIPKQILADIYQHLLFIQASLFSSIYIDFQPDFHLSPSGFFEPLTFILSSAAVRMAEVMLLACSLES